MNLQLEFQSHNPRLIYVEHRFLDDGRIGFSYKFVYAGQVYRGVLIYNVVDGKIDWRGRAEMFDSWKDINKKER